jgi:glycosyltransferase involved in cell wall biosynthesis
MMWLTRRTAVDRTGYLMNLTTHMRLLIISPSYPPAPAGEAEHCFQIASRLAALGHQVTVLTTAAPGMRKPSGFELKTSAVSWRWRDLPAVMRAVLEVQPQVVLLIYTGWLFEDHPMPTYLPTLVRRLLPSCRFVTLFETYAEANVQSALVRIGRKIASLLSGRERVHYHLGTLLRDSDGLVALGPAIVDAYVAEDANVKGRMVVVPPPPLLPDAPTVDEHQRSSLRLEQGLEANEFVLAYFGFVYPGKGVETLINALALLNRSGRRVRLLMAGGGRGTGDAFGRHNEYELQARQLAESLGVRAQIEWLQGYAEADQRVLRPLLAADLAVLPFDDGAELRRSSISAVAALGLPILTTTPREIQQVFVHQESVWLVPPRDSGALADAIIQLADSAPMRRKLGDGALAMSERWFSWKRTVSRIELVLAGREVVG